MPWCGTFVGAKLRQSGSTLITSASAKDYAGNRAYKLSDVIYGIYTPKPGDLRVKLRKGGGHVDIFVNDSMFVGGNVSDMVKLRKYTIQSMIADRTTHIIPYE